MPSSPIDNGAGPGDQLLSEASQNSQYRQNGTPAAQTNPQPPQSSSPMFFRSSPVNGATSHGTMHDDDVSMGGATPRPSGLSMGGKVYSLCMVAFEVATLLTSV